MNSDPTAGSGIIPIPSIAYRDSEGIRLGEEQVPALEIIIEVEESTGEGRAQEAVEPTQGWAAVGW